MLGPIITVGVGALTFKLGMEAQKMHASGYSCSEIAQNFARSACATVRNAVAFCADRIGCAIPGCYYDAEDESPTKKSPRSSKKPRRRADGRFC